MNLNHVYSAKLIAAASGAWIYAAYVSENNIRSGIGCIA